MTINRAEHIQRILTALLGFIAIGLLYFLFQHVAVQLIAVFISLVSFYEYLQCLLEKENTPFLKMTKICVGITAAAIFLLPLERSYLWSIGLLVFYFLALYRFRGTSLSKSSGNETLIDITAKEPYHIHDLFIMCFGIIYLCGFTIFITDIHLLPNGPFWLLCLFCIIWTDDIAAYYGGHRFGKHKLAPYISPGKTMEGSLFGILGAVAIVIAMHQYYRIHYPSHSISIFSMLFLGFSTAVIAQLGDLFESLLKRIAGVKNSGSLLPGHGGVFDRFDSLILAAPFYYYFLRRWIV